MRQPSFEKYLLTYAQELTGCDSQSLNKLLSLSLNGHARAFEPLVLLCILKGKKGLLLTKLAGTTFKHNIEFMLSKDWDKGSLISFLVESEEENHNLERYRKVYRSYQAMVSRPAVDREVVLLMRERILEVMKEKKLSNYRVYTDLSLNHGNINRYLKHGDASKLSRQTARRILDYVISIQSFNERWQTRVCLTRQWSGRPFGHS